MGETQNLKDACESKIALVVKQIMQNENHPLYPYYVFMRSGKRLRSMNCRTQRFFNSFVPFFYPYVQSNFYIIISLILSFF